GLTGATAKRFEIGFAPDDRSGLQEHLAAKGVPVEDMIACGMLAKSDDGRVYPRFRGRIMFPIRDARGRCISFGGRSMDPNARAKYLNGPETTLFDKGRNLYNIAMARAAVGKAGRLVVAEGYMDVIALAEAGFDASVAPLGTAVTDAQIQMMWRLAEEPTITLDGDAAGSRAAYRLIDLALPHIGPGRTLRFCLMPDGLDPDDFLRQRGAAAMEEALTGALPLVEMLWRRETEGKAFDAPEHRAALDVALGDAARKIADARLRRHYVDALMARRNALFGITGQGAADFGPAPDRAQAPAAMPNDPWTGSWGPDDGPEPSYDPSYDPRYDAGYGAQGPDMRGAASDWQGGRDGGRAAPQQPWRPKDRKRAPFKGGKFDRSRYDAPEGPSPETRASALARVGRGRVAAPSLSVAATDAARVREGAILTGALAHPAAAMALEDALARSPFVNADLARIRDALLDALGLGDPPATSEALRARVDAAVGRDSWAAAGAPAAVALTRALSPDSSPEVAAAALAEVLDRHSAILSALEETEDAARSLLEDGAGEDITYRLAAALLARDAAGGAAAGAARLGESAEEDADASRRLQGFSIPTRSGRKG
ncbi:MAG: DNA primase, partial [Paracoccaceae bacterium]